MRKTFTSLLLLAATLGSAHAEGLTPPAHLAATWGLRLSLPSVDAQRSIFDAPRTLVAARLYSDYYLATPRLGDTGGARLTGGLLLGSRSRPLLAEVPEGLQAWPYVGVGYSGASARHGWGFNADLGLAAQSPGALRLGQRLDDAVRELRLQPLLQLEVSYRF